MNATVMARPYGRSKRVGNYLRGKDILEYINALHASKSMSQIRDIEESSLIQASRGRGEDAGTWLQEDLALRYSQWLNPRFSLWCDQRIKEILNQGFSALTPEATDYINEEIGKEVNMINDIVYQIQTGVKKPGFEFTSHQKINSQGA